MRELAATSRVFCGLWGLVPGGGVEPPRPEGRRILSPLRLPVPPSRLSEGCFIVRQAFGLCQFLSACETPPGIWISRPDIIHRADAVRSR
jgi:hypothetical protein